MTALSVSATQTVRDHGYVPADESLLRRLRNAGNKQIYWRAERDRLVLEAHEAGSSLREIASAIGLSNPGVLRIVNRGKMLKKIEDEMFVEDAEAIRRWEEQ